MRPNDHANQTMRPKSATTMLRRACFIGSKITVCYLPIHLLLLMIEPWLAELLLAAFTLPWSLWEEPFLAVWQWNLQPTADNVLTRRLAHLAYGLSSFWLNATLLTVLLKRPPEAPQSHP